MKQVGKMKTSLLQVLKSGDKHISPTETNTYPNNVSAIGAKRANYKQHKVNTKTLMETSG